MKIEIRKERVYNLSENEIETKYIAYLVSDEEDEITLDVRLSDSEYSDLEIAVENTMLEINNFKASKEDIEIEHYDITVDEDEKVAFEYYL